MRLKSYINEIMDPSEAALISEKIKTMCKPFLKEFGENFKFYRGMRERINYTFKNVRTDRKPKDMRKSISTALNIVLNEKIGWKPRTEGVFAATKARDAERYGNIYIIYPVGKYKYVYWTEFRDSIYLQNKILDYYLRRIYKNLDSTEYYNNVAESIRLNKKLSPELMANLIRATKQAIKDFPPKTNGLKKHKNKRIEVTIKCKQYIAVKEKDPEDSIFITGSQ